MGSQSLVAESEVNNVYRVPSVLVPSLYLSSVINKTIKTSASKQLYSISDISTLHLKTVNKSTSKTQIWQDRGEGQEARSNMKQISPVRTFLRPMRTPSRLDNPEDLSTPMSRPSSELCRFRCRSWDPSLFA